MDGLTEAEIVDRVLQDDAPRERPGVLAWLRYAYTGRAPQRSAAWVLYDGTCSTWLLRFLARYLLQVLPFLVLLVVFLPAPLPLRFGSAVAGLFASLLFGAGYFAESVERRVAKAGYPYGVATKIRERRSVDGQSVVAARNRAKREARRSARAARARRAR